jgi:hypothetical protein
MQNTKLTWRLEKYCSVRKDAYIRSVRNPGQLGPKTTRAPESARPYSNSALVNSAHFSINMKKAKPQSELDFILL